MKISCIIPAYNEGLRIAKVLEVVTSCLLIDEIIVVDDGSKDDTQAVVSAFPNIRLLIHKFNQGKSASVCTGVSASLGDFVVLIDADLVGLCENDLVSLIRPVIDGQADVSLSLRRNSLKIWHFIGLDYISGERVLPRRIIFEHISDILKLPKFGLEVFLNSLIIKNKYRIKVVPWLDVDSPYKYKKYGFWRGIKGDIKMVVDILKTVSVFGLIYQIIKMRQLRIFPVVVKEKLKLSFIIPAYNEEKYLGKCLQSVVEQIKKFPEQIEIIVVNNASTDRTKEIALSYPGVIVVDEPHKGLTYARQAGYLASDGELLANIDADTILSSGWLEKVFFEFSRNPNLVALSGPYIYYDMSWQVRAMTKIWYVFGYLLHLINHHILKIGAMIQGGNFIVRRSALKKIGGFNLDITFFGEDTDLARRIQTVGLVKFVFSLSMKTTGRRLKGEGLFSTSWHYAVNHLWILYRKKPLNKKYEDFRKNE